MSFGCLNCSGSGTEKRRSEEAQGYLQAATTANAR